MGFFLLQVEKKKKKEVLLCFMPIYTLVAWGASSSYITYLVQVQLWLRSGARSLRNWLVLF